MKKRLLHRRLPLRRKIHYTLDSLRTQKMKEKKKERTKERKKVKEKKKKNSISIAHFTIARLYAIYHVVVQNVGLFTCLHLNVAEKVYLKKHK